MALEMALDTFGDVTFGPDGTLKPQDQVIRDVVEQAVLADQVGVDFIGLGEHHRDDFAISAPETVLAAIAAKTSRIRLGTAVTVLSSDDPIRVFQRFSTLNALSEGRAEVILGRGSFTESFPLFGFDLSDYETLFNEKLDLFTRLLREARVTWSGSIRPPLRNQPVYPSLSQPLKAWIGVGGTPESVARAVHYNLAVIFAIIGGAPSRFRPFVDLYHRACDQLGRDPQPIAVHSPGHVAATDEAAREEIWPGYKALHDRIGRERGWPPTDRAHFDREISHGSLYVGSPETVARKIADTVKALGLGRFEMKYSSGPMPHDAQMRSIELYGTRVMPMVRDMLS
ncbi:LLM class flavin-dependent oxidoreductase [Defluviimonas aestuarii]|uniref:LLM class flavin-dependent oxidoreductase n=1 Tax=Albidovulum aestuarii TaxID=1130726 RepID=UPI00249B0F5A|nr:LLM class flavin-dependent oxidoreductase [Defluviimonas aestuarii]MDI3338387.1 LLM class flavin-dependent oxidoreductase [Defluviimonas aestuarii]